MKPLAVWFLKLRNNGSLPAKVSPRFRVWRLRAKVVRFRNQGSRAWGLMCLGLRVQACGSGFVLRAEGLVLSSFLRPDSLR